MTSSPLSIRFTQSIPFDDSWTALKRMGKSEVRHHLEQNMYVPPNAPFLHADTGLRHGATRYPTRGFVMDWAADAPQDDGGVWRALTICAIFAMVGAGVLFFAIH